MTVPTMVGVIHPYVNELWRSCFRNEAHDYNAARLEHTYRYSYSLEWKVR